ncbi:hypothetical protein FOCC_FOCC017884, partial [Frankliniella occidentalis]
MQGGVAHSRNGQLCGGAGHALAVGGHADVGADVLRAQRHDLQPGGGHEGLGPAAHHHHEGGVVTCTKRVASGHEDEGEVAVWAGGSVAPASYSLGSGVAMPSALMRSQDGDGAGKPFTSHSRDTGEPATYCTGAGGVTIHGAARHGPRCLSHTRTGGSSWPPAAPATRIWHED